MILLKIEEAFGKVLKDVRLEKSMSQEELAYLSGLDRTFISMLERGKRQPSLTTLFVLSSALEIQPNQLINQIEKLLAIH